MYRRMESQPLTAFPEENAPTLSEVPVWTQKSTCRACLQAADRTEKQHLLDPGFFFFTTHTPTPHFLLKFPTTSGCSRFAQQVPEHNWEEGKEIAENAKRPPRSPITPWWVSLYNTWGKPTGFLHPRRPRSGTKMRRRRSREETSLNPPVKFWPDAWAPGSL